MYILLFGPLFPWSPWKPGYAVAVMRRADVYHAGGTPLPLAYRQIDALMEDAEAFHQLSFRKRITVVACSTWPEFHRFAPHLTDQGIGGVTLATGTVIYLSPRIGEKQLDHGEFLRHELSHALLNQHQPLAAALRSANKWPFEGVAAAFGRQTSYKSEQELKEFARSHSLLLVVDPDLRGRDFDVTIALTTWRFFSEFLMTEDRAAYQRFLTAFMDDPENWREHFVREYRVDLSTALSGFQQRLISDASLPSPSRVR